MQIKNLNNAVRNGRGSRLKKADKWASLLGGGALAVYGITRKSLTGAAVAAAGGYLIYRGANNRTAPLSVHVQKTFTIMRPVEDVYSFWRNFTNLP